MAVMKVTPSEKIVYPVRPRIAKSERAGSLNAAGAKRRRIRSGIR